MTAAETLASALLQFATSAARGAPLLLVALLLARGARGWSASLRHAVLAAALVAQGLLVVAPGLAPSIEVPVPRAWSAVARPALLAGEAGVRAPSRGVSASEAHSVRDAAGAMARPVQDAEGAVAGAAGGPDARGARSRLSPVVSIGGLWAAIAGLWAAVAGLSLLGLLAGVTRRTRRGREGEPPSASVAAEAHRHARVLGIRRPVRVAIAEEAAVPCTWGALRPVLLLPPSFAGWPRDRRRAVLLHELAHVRRLDAVWRGLADVLASVLWFDPLVHWLRRELRETSERACDDAVLRAGVRPSSYAGHLVAVARAVLPARAVSGSSMVRRGGLERRARAILDPRPSRSGAGARPATTASLAAAPAAFLIAGLTAALPLAYGAPVCPYAGGRHLDRLRPAEGGGTAWEVEWEGRSCRVAVSAEGAVVFAADLSGVEALGRGAGLTIDLRTVGGARRLTVVPGEGGRPLVVWRVDGEARPFDREARGWLRSFLVELDRHTGFAVDARLPALLRGGGPEAVIAEAARSEGGHAGGIYLRRLAQERALRPRQLGRLLATATAVVSVDAEMASLLRVLRSRYDSSVLESAGYREAAETLQARAAREES